MRLIKTLIDLNDLHDSSQLVLLGTWCVKKKIELLDQINDYNIAFFYNILFSKDQSF